MWVYIAPLILLIGCIYFQFSCCYQFFRMSTPVSMEGDNIEPANIEIERQDDHLHSYIDSQPMNENNTHNDDNEIDEAVEKWTNENQVDDIEEVEDVIGRKKRSKVWDEFKEVSLPTGQKKRRMCTL
ncbi:hypothetical protein KFK09_019084 [Dendrobium nobile]|uniref:Transmembrane protein n=1 Tax=Dendrobium nobile TaxID=94219 RepID=A0A8T3AW87_DENNO|nr:hypothetical protein KFK09_019084 [Dendrobium nobile]